MSARSQDGKRLSLSSDGAVSFEDNGNFLVEIEGLQPESEVKGLLFSDPVTLGTVMANSRGALTHSFDLPENVPSGEHRFVLQMIDNKSQEVDLTLGVVTLESGNGSGVRILVLGVLGLGILFAFFLPAALKRRRSAQ